MNRTSAVSILALGSPHGDDQVAWRTADLLRHDPEFTGQVVTLDSPFQLLTHFTSDTATIILDACQSGATPGTLVRVDESRLASLRSCEISSHGGTVVDAIRMAEALGRKPLMLEILAIEIASSAPGSDMTLAGRRGITLLRQAVREVSARMEKVSGDLSESGDSLNTVHIRSNSP